MNQNQVVKVLKNHIDIQGMAKDIAVSVSGQKVKIIKVKEFPKERFIDNGNGTIIDTHFGLTWVKSPHTDLPEKFKSSMVWKEAIQACKELSFSGHKDWRLPTVEELRSIVDYTRGAKDNEPAIDTKYFLDTKCSWYWTVTPCAWSRGNAWVVAFHDGYVGDGNEDGSSYVRPVRSSQ
jgi:hypothetical protein